MYASVKPTNIASDNGLSPIRRQAIIGTNAVILSIRPQWTYFSEISIRIQTFSFKKMHLKVSSEKWRPFCLGLNVLNGRLYVCVYTGAHIFVCMYMYICEYMYNKHVYRQSQVRMPNDSEVEWAKCSLIIGTGVAPVNVVTYHKCINFFPLIHLW